MPDAKPGFRAVQSRFAACVRDPGVGPPPAGVELRGLEVYRDLCYHNVESFMANAYPVCRAILGEGRWHALIGAYFREHRARTVSYPRMPRELLRYLEARGAVPDTPPFLRELADYEWLELEVSFDEHEIGEILVDPEIDCLDGVPVLNPTVRLRSYRWPVHRLGPHYQPELPPEAPSQLCCLRRRDDGVTFMALTPATARLVNLVAGNAARSGRALLATIAGELAAPDAAAVIAAGAAMLTELQTSEVLLGARRAR